MIPSELATLFWDTDLEKFKPDEYPDYTIFRVLEYGNEEALAWLQKTFSEAEIRRVLRSERRLTRKSANFWALVFGVPCREVAALNLGG